MRIGIEFAEELLPLGDVIHTYALHRTRSRLVGADLSRDHVLSCLRKFGAEYHANMAALGHVVAYRDQYGLVFVESAICVDELPDFMTEFAA